MRQRDYRNRRARLVALGLALVCSVCAPALWADHVTPSGRVESLVVVREEASLASDRVGELHKGQRAVLLDRVPRWYRVRLEDGTTGFVSKSWVRVEKDLADRQPDELRIHFLNIGAGTCTVVECPGQDAPPMVIDCGSLGGTEQDMTRDEAKSHIQAILEGHTESPNAVLSHADQDHYGWIPEVLKDTRVTHIWQGGNPEEYTELNFPEWLVETVGRDQSSTTVSRPILTTAASRWATG